MNRLIPVLGLLAVSVAFAPAQREGRAEKINRGQENTPWVLRKAIDVASKLRYVGSRTVEFRKDGKTERYTELVTKDGDNLRIEFPSGSKYAGQIIVEGKDERRHFFPDKNEIHILPPRREEAMSRLARMVKRPGRFVLSSADGEVVAGNPTTQVVVSDQKGNVMQRLFISRSGLLLKREMFDPVGTPVGGFEFTSVDTSPKIYPGLFRLERKGAKVVRPTDMLRSAAQEGGFVFAMLKPSTGYNLMFSRASKADGNDLLMQFYAQDGQRLSLFQVKSEVSSEQLSEFAHDLQVYSFKSRGNTFILMGTQDVADLKKLSRAMTYGN
ncbi:hypothetical protein BH11ARM1_BH11ARM1_04470 [soil metagenome]